MTPVVRSRVRICSRGMNAFSGYKLLVKIAHTLLKKVGSTHSKTLQHSGLNIFLFPQFGIFQFQALIFHTKSGKCTENPDQLKPEYLNSGYLVFYTAVQNVRLYLTESFLQFETFWDRFIGYFDHCVDSGNLHPVEQCRRSTLPPSVRLQIVTGKRAKLLSGFPFMRLALLAATTKATIRTLIRARMSSKCK